MHMWTYAKLNSEYIYTARSKGRGKLHRHVGKGDGMEGRCQTDPKERF